MRQNTKSIFWSRVERKTENDCWLWTRGKNSSGYGTFIMGGVSGLAHRWAYLFTNGEIPNGMVVRHTCDNRLCCNPFHLIIGTVADNNADCVRRGRHVAPCGADNGRAKLTPDQVACVINNPQSSYMLADEFGVNPTTIQRIRSGKLWAAEAARNKETTDDNN